jgi:ATP-dependent DNA ligase
MADDTSRLRVPDPMLATLGMPPTGPAWAIEFKWDGFRGRLRAVGSNVSVYTRNGADTEAIIGVRGPAADDVRRRRSPSGCYLVGST